MRARPHFNPFNVVEPDEKPNWAKVFANPKLPLDLEIGCSAGRWMISYANQHPERNIIGVEIRTKYIALLKERIADLGLTNAYVVKANINTSLPKLFAEQSLNNVFLMFPDPWYKKKHLKRRVLTSEFSNELARFMVAGGLLHVATDQKFLAEDMLMTLERSPFFRNVHGENNFAAENIPGVVTDIEEFNVARGKEIYRMVFERA